MTTIKKISTAIYSLFFFKTYTTMPRWLEICYGIMAWLQTFVLIYATIIIIKGIS